MISQYNKKLIDYMKLSMDVNNYSIHTKRSYCRWGNSFIRFHKIKKRSDFLNPKDKIKSFLRHLDVDENVALATQKTAMNALIFLYRSGLKEDLKFDINWIRKNNKRYIPEVLTQKQTFDLIRTINGNSKLVVKLLYGSGLRPMEAIRLRVRDINYKSKCISVMSSDGTVNRIAPLPSYIINTLKNHMRVVQELHRQDIEDGYGRVEVPKNIPPRSKVKFCWQYIFPSRSLSTSDNGLDTIRNHIELSVVNRAINVATKKLKINKKISPNSFRHCFARDLFKNGTDVKSIQKLLGDRSINVTMTYNNILQDEEYKIKSPLDDILE